MLTHPLTFFSWNVRSLGQSQRCDDVLSELIAQRPTFASLQETKLSDIDKAKLKAFLPARLSQHAVLPSVGASGGILTAWDVSVCSLRAFSMGAYSLTTSFSLLRDNTNFTLTNVYAPTEHAEKQLFLQELVTIANSIDEPWVIVGDFNMTREPGDKNKQQQQQHIL